MAKYGQILNTFEPDKEEIYTLISTYFDEPVMSKIKDVAQLSMYMTKIHTLLNNQNRYLVAIVDKDEYPLGHQESLSNLKWISFQTRTLEDQYKISPHKYIPKRNAPYNLLIHLKEKNDKKTEYTCKEFPILITLLPPLKTSQPYQDTGSITASLETYNTVITFNL